MEILLYIIAPILGSLTWESNEWSKNRKKWQVKAQKDGVSELKVILNERLDNFVKSALLGWGSGFIMASFDVNAMAERITGVEEFHFTGHGLAYVLAIVSDYWFSKFKSE